MSQALRRFGRRLEKPPGSGPAWQNYSDKCHMLRCDPLFFQDIILHERFSKDQLAKLAAIGFDNPAEVRLEAWSEFLQSPSANVESTVLKTSPGQNLAEPYMMDDRINFGTMFMPQGTGLVETDQTRRS